MLFDEDPLQDMREMDLAKKYAEQLEAAYPGHLWAVTVDLRGGVAQVFNMSLTGRYGFVIKLSRLKFDPKALVMAGGEILERYRLSRGKMIEAEIAGLKRDFSGAAIGDLSGA